MSSVCARCRFWWRSVRCGDLRKIRDLKGEVHPKMITSYLVVFGALSQIVKI